MTPISYTVYSSKANYLVFSINPNYNIEHTLIKANISGGSYELFNNTSKYIST